MLPFSHHSHPYSAHRINPTVIFATQYRASLDVQSAILPDGAVIVTDEHGNIQGCNAEAQHLFHCLPFYAEEKKLSEVMKIVPRNHARYAPTLWEMAHSTRRPLAFPEIDVALPCGERHPMDVCSVWLNELHEGHLRMAFIFSKPVSKALAGMLDSSESAIEEGIIVHKKHTVLETSRSLDTMFGYKEGEILGRDIACLMSDTDVSTLMHAAKIHDTQMFQGLVVRRNHLLMPIGFRSFPLAHLSADVIVTRLYAPIS